MNFNGQSDSDINPMLLNVSKCSLGRYGRRQLLYPKEQHPDVYTTMIFQGTLGRHLEEINEECRDRIFELTEQLHGRKALTKRLRYATSYNGFGG